MPQAQSRIIIWAGGILGPQTEIVINTAIGMTPNDPRHEKPRKIISLENLGEGTLGLPVGNLGVAEILVLQLELALL